MKENFTKDEVIKILKALKVSSKIINPNLQEGDLDLLKEVGFNYYSVENGHGGYDVLKYEVSR